jgi:hypothetical protein
MTPEQPTKPLMDSTITAVVSVITGDGRRSPYRTGEKLVGFFNALGNTDTYPFKDDCSREKYVVRKLSECNGTGALREILEASVRPADFHDTAFDVTKAVVHLNRFLRFDGLELLPVGQAYVLRSTDPDLVGVALADGTQGDLCTFITLGLAKSEEKLQQEDYDGAITNARSVLEAVMKHIETLAVGTPTETKGDLIKQFAAVKNLLGLDPSRDDIHPSLKQTLSGLVSVVNGIAAARNAMSDAHARPYTPAAHHARLVVNASRTVSEFLLSAFENQQAKSMILPGGPR